MHDFMKEQFRAADDFDTPTLWQSVAEVYVFWRRLVGGRRKRLFKVTLIKEQIYLAYQIT